MKQLTLQAPWVLVRFHGSRNEAFAKDAICGIPMQQLSAIEIVSAVLTALSSKESGARQSAFMMDGTSKRSGAVAAVGCSGAVQAAQTILQKTPYMLLQGSGAEFFGQPGRGSVFSGPLSATCIAVDEGRNISCGSYDYQDGSRSISDTAIIGNGFFADSKVGAAAFVVPSASNPTSGRCLAWLAVQLMGEATSPVEIVAKCLQDAPADSISHFGAIVRTGQMYNCLVSSFVQGESFFVARSLDLQLEQWWSTAEAKISLPIQQLPENSDSELAIIVHGGAGSGVTPEYAPAYTNGVKTAVLIGHKVLKAGGSALEATQAAVASMENDPVFNAGYGAALNCKGDIEMDAMIQCGRSKAFGAVGGVTTVKNPIQLTYRMLKNSATANQLLVGLDAESIADTFGSDIVRVDNASLKSDKAKNAWKNWKEKNPGAICNDGQYCEAGALYGTVGAVAVDRQGNVAAATSTGGLTGKLVGRVGDTPISGTGTYADNAIGAASATGVGEHIMATCTTRACLHFAAKNGLSAQQAADKAIEHLSDNLPTAGGGPGRGGIIFVASPVLTAARPLWGQSFNTEGMAWAAIDETDGGRMYWGLKSGESNTEQLPTTNSA